MRTIFESPGGKELINLAIDSTDGGWRQRNGMVNLVYKMLDGSEEQAIKWITDYIKYNQVMEHSYSELAKVYGKKIKRGAVVIPVSREEMKVLAGNLAGLQISDQYAIYVSTEGYGQAGTIHHETYHDIYASLFLEHPGSGRNEPSIYLSFTEGFAELAEIDFKFSIAGITTPKVVFMEQIKTYFESLIDHDGAYVVTDLIQLAKDSETGEEFKRKFSSYALPYEQIESITGVESRDPHSVGLAVAAIFYMMSDDAADALGKSLRTPAPDILREIFNKIKNDQEFNEKVVKLLS